MLGLEVDFLPFVLAGSMFYSGILIAGSSPRTQVCWICLTTREAGEALSISPTCMNKLTP